MIKITKDDWNTSVRKQLSKIRGNRQQLNQLTQNQVFKETFIILDIIYVKATIILYLFSISNLRFEVKYFSSVGSNICIYVYETTLN